MREILFRGKRVDNGEWVEGFCQPVYNQPGKAFIGWYERADQIIPTIRGVIPETIVQYTGLTDKNGKKIFEGDIVEFYFFDKTRRNGEFVEVKNTKTMVIEWYGASFYMQEFFRNYRLDKEMGVITEVIYDYKGDRKQGVYKSNSVYFVEVIGNIHDNPELLKEGAPHA